MKKSRDPIFENRAEEGRFIKKNDLFAGSSCFRRVPDGIVHRIAERGRICGLS
jgi:hypothetical protein